MIKLFVNDEVFNFAYIYRYPYSCDTVKIWIIYQSVIFLRSLFASLL